MTLTAEDLVTRRLKSCIENWSECQSGEYNPSCCRFPKSCSPHGYMDAVLVGTLTEDDLEPETTSIKGAVMTEDSTLGTLKHSRRVDELMLEIITGVQDRLTKHDQSKMEDPEKAIFDEFSPKLKTSTYGTDEYWGFLQSMKSALDHHYANNRHHPEHFTNGINGMTLVDLIEMLADWKAAGERHADGSLDKSLEIQKDRFGISDQLLEILTNTAREFGWLDG